MTSIRARLADVFVPKAAGAIGVQVALDVLLSELYPALANVSNKRIASISGMGTDAAMPNASYADDTRLKLAGGGWLGWHG